MGQMTFPIGSGKTKNTGIGTKARMLDRAAQAGLPVPLGCIVRAEMLQVAILKGCVTEDDDGTISVTEPERLDTLLDLPTFGQLVAVRSAFSTEDHDVESFAGYFDTVLHVNANDADDMAVALGSVWSSAARQAGDFRRDILVMEMVDAQVSGIAFSERTYEDDLINYTDGTAEQLASGQIGGQQLNLPRLRSYESSRNGLPDWAQRLQTLLRDVRRIFGAKDWDVEWADDGKRCWVIQIRPVTRPTRRNEVFSIANHKEILPELPSVFMTDIVASCASELFQYYRNFDPGLPANRPFIEVFYGRPFINLSLMTEMMRTFGLPTRLVTDNIGGQVDREFGLNLRRMLVKILQGALPRFALAQLFSVNSARKAQQRMEERLENIGTTFSEQVETLRWLYINLVSEMFSLTAAIGPMTLLLRQFGVLTEHNARQQTISTAMYADLSDLRDYVANRPELHDDLKAGKLPDDLMFQTLWEKYIEKYGHRGVYESDIARPRYHEAPGKLLPALIQPQRDTPLPRRSLRGWLTLPLWWQASRTIRAREQWRHVAMRGFDAVRQALLTRAEEWVEAGKLPDRDCIWQMRLDEIRRLDTGWIPGVEYFAERKAEIAELKQYRLPDLFHRFDDLEASREAGTAPGDHLHGISLTDGIVAGRAWVLEEPESVLPDGFRPDETVLVARSVDAGWIPVFSTVAGVVVETGGDLSHGSIILREIGLPAITNVHDALKFIRTGDPVRLRAGSGVVYLLTGALEHVDEESDSVPSDASLQLERPLNDVQMRAGS